MVVTKFRESYRSTRPKIASISPQAPPTRLHKILNITKWQKDLDHHSLIVLLSPVAYFSSSLLLLDKYVNAS